MSRRDANRAAAVRTDGEGCDAYSNGRARARARAAGGHGEIPGVAGRGKDRIVPDAAVAELGNIGLAKDDSARRPEPLHADVVLVRHEVSVPGRTHHGQNVFSGDKVLDPYRDTRERTGIFARGNLSVDGARRGERHFWRRRTEGVNMRFERLHAPKRGLRDLRRRQLLGFDQRRNRNRVGATDFIVGVQDSSLRLSDRRRRDRGPLFATEA